MSKRAERALAKLRKLVADLAAVVDALATAAAGSQAIAVASKPRKPRFDAKTWPYQGQPHTVRQLAELAGVTPHTMRERLSRLPPEVAVGQGKTKFAPGRLRTFVVNGETLSVADLAKRAGISWVTMYQRLRRYSPEEAVRIPLQRRGITVRKPGPKAEPARKPIAATQAPTPAPTRAPTPAPTRAPTPAPTAAPEVIVPANVKRTVAKAPPGRFDVQQAPSTFGRIGQYEETGSAVARQYRRGA